MSGLSYLDVCISFTVVNLSIIAGKFGVVLDFCQRVDIAIDIAHALTYLHLYAGNTFFPFHYISTIDI